MLMLQLVLIYFFVSEGPDLYPTGCFSTMQLCSPSSRMKYNKRLKGQDGTREGTLTSHGHRKETDSSWGKKKSI